MSDLQRAFRKKIVPVTFERTTGLFGATTIGVGALLGAGVYVLIGMAAAFAGPSVWISYAMCGGLALLTTFLYAELARKLPISGGGYAYAYKMLGSIGGFITGWFLALGSIFACGLYAIGFAQYLGSLLGLAESNAIGATLLALGLVAASTVMNAKGTDGADRVQALFTWGNVGIIAVLLVFAAFQAEPANLQPQFPNGFGGTFSAISIIYISFFGYQLIANSTDEIKEPEKTVPKAMLYAMLLSFAVYLLVALAAILVVPWQELAASNAPLLLVANKAFGQSGFYIIAIGGILASAGALNSTLLSQGRQIYMMGKHRFLPELLGTLNQQQKTPVAAIVAGGALVVIVLVLLPLEFIAQSANFCLLASLLPVSVALRKLYRKYPKKRPKGLVARLLPELSLVANIGLLLALDWVAMLFGLQLMIIGAVVYYLYSRKTENRQRSGVNIVLSEKKSSPTLLKRGMRILLPLANPKTHRALLAVSSSLLQRDGGEIAVLSVVQTPEQTDFYTALAEAEHKLDILNKSNEHAQYENIPIKPIVRASHSLSKGIVHAAEEENADLIIMGYGGKSNSKQSSLMEQVLQEATKNVVFLKLHVEFDTFHPKRIGISVSGRNNLVLLNQLASALADTYESEITLLTVLRTDYTTEQRLHASSLLSEMLSNVRSMEPCHTKMLVHDEPLTALRDYSLDLDLLIVGTTRVSLLQRAVIGSFAAELAEQAYCPVAIVRASQGVRKFIKSLS
jgi:amino acid transporter